MGQTVGVKVEIGHYNKQARAAYTGTSTANLNTCTYVLITKHAKANVVTVYLL